MKILLSLIALLSLIPTLHMVGQPQWNQVGPYGGYIQSLAKDTGGNIYAGTLFGGIFKTTNNGDLWVQTYNDTSVVDFRSIAINASGHIFAGLNPGFMRSTDGGASWQKIVNSLNTRTIATLLVLPNGNIFAGALSGGLYRSTDNGQTFSLYTNGMSASSIRMVARNPTSGHLFAATNGNGIFRSTDDGANWVAINTGITTTQMNSVGLSPSGDLYASGDTKIFRSTDNGANWTDLVAPSAAYWDFAFAGSSVFVSYAGSTAIGGGVSVSTNNGSTWTSEPGLPNIPFNRIIASGNTVIAGCLGRGTFRSTATQALWGPWTQANEGMFAVRVQELLKESFLRYNGISRDGDVFSSSDQGATWISISSNLPYGLLQSITTNPSGHVFLGHQNGIFRSTNLGESWTNVNPGVSLPTLGTDDQGKVYAGSGSAIYSTTNNGTNWSFTSLPGVTNISDFAFDGSNVFVATGNFETTIGHGVYRSTDRGVTFNPMNNGLPALNVTSVDVLPDTSSQCKIVAGTKTDGIFIWNGLQWVAGGLANKPIRRIRTTSLRIATDALDVFGQSSGCSWSLVADRQTFKARVTDVRETVSNIAGSLQNITLLVATNGRGIYRGTNVITSIPEQNTVPEDFDLEQNYPNPFNPATTIRYEIPNTQHVTIGIFDLLGREVATLVNGQMSRGTHTVTWDAAGHPSGVYFYRLSSGDFLSTKKLVLLK